MPGAGLGPFLLHVETVIGLLLCLHMYPGVTCKTRTVELLFRLGRFVVGQVQTHVAIPFSKGTLWKKAIEKGTLDSCKESHNDWLALAGKSLQPSPSLNGKKSGVSLPQGQPANSRRSQDGPNVTEVLQKAEPQFHADMTRVLGRASEPVPRYVGSTGFPASC